MTEAGVADQDSLPNWDQRYRQATGAAAAAVVLTAHQHLLPVTGMALDLACGLGANALLLAGRGLTTWAWDSSVVAIERLCQTARTLGLPVQAEVRDVVTHPPEAERFDVIVVSHFLERALAPALVAALRPGGLLFYQTFTRQRVAAGGPRNPAFLLAENELLRLFAPLVVRVYREEGLTGDTGRGWRNEALLVAQKIIPGRGLKHS
jgi:SAM-dependent methyltransferase